MLPMDNDLCGGIGSLALTDGQKRSGIACRGCAFENDVQQNGHVPGDPISMGICPLQGQHLGIFLWNVGTKSPEGYATGRESGMSSKCWWRMGTPHLRPMNGEQYSVKFRSAV
jgi:hypothetical protein